MACTPLYDSSEPVNIHRYLLDLIKSYENANTCWCTHIEQELIGSMCYYEIKIPRAGQRDDAKQKELTHHHMKK